MSAFYGLEGNVIKFGNIPVFPGLTGTYGNETIRDHARVHFGSLRGGLVVTLMDVWVLNPQIWGELNVACWVPIDHEPTPPPIRDFFRMSGAVPIAMSKFGRDLLAADGLDPLYVPHGVDCDIYKPYDKREARNATGLPDDRFIVGMVAANKGNPSRKCFHEAFQAFKALNDRHPDALLYVHTEVTGRFDGVSIPELIRNVGLDMSNVVFCDQYRAVHYPFPPETMAKLYSSLDVLLMPSAGEGFGIPAIEAQACGVPVIASDFSAQPELVGSGWLVSGRKVYTPLKAWQFLPDVDDIADALNKAHSARGRTEYAEKARAHALTYDAKVVARNMMLPALDEAWGRFESRNPVELKAAA